MENYFYVDKNQKQAGPIMPSQFAAAGVTPQTLVWRKGIDQWTPAGELDELREYFHPQTNEATQLTATPSPATTKPSAAPAHPTAQETAPSFAPSQPTSTPQANEIHNYLWLAVLSVVFMCSPIGIVAIHHAAKVDYYSLRGNISEATRRSGLARKWSFIALAISFVWFLFLLSTFGGQIVSYLYSNYEFAF